MIRGSKYVKLYHDSDPKAIYDCNISFTQMQHEHYWSVGKNMPYVGKGVIGGMLNFSGYTCELPSSMLKPTTKYNIYHMDTYPTTGDRISLYTTPKTYQFNWTYEKTNFVGQYFSATEEIVRYEPEFTGAASDQDQDYKCTNTMFCEPAILVDGIVVPEFTAVTRATLTLGYSPFPHIFNYNDIVNTIIKARQLNRGVVTSSLVVNVQDGFYNFTLGGLYPIRIYTTATRYWELKWMRYSGISNFRVSPSTGSIISADLNFRFSGLDDDMVIGHIKLPDTTILWGS